MKILLVEDDENKLKNLQVFLNSIVELKPLELDLKKSYQSGLNAVLSNNYDLVLLDMSMHNFDKSISETGGDHMHFAGEDILREMSWNDISTKTIVVTQYDLIGNKSLTELKESWAVNFSENYVDTVFYRDNETNWKTELEALIKLHTTK